MLVSHISLDILQSWLIFRIALETWEWACAFKKITNCKWNLLEKQVIASTLFQTYNIVPSRQQIVEWEQSLTRSQLLQWSTCQETVALHFDYVENWYFMPGAHLYKMMVARFQEGGHFLQPKAIIRFVVAQDFMATEFEWKAFYVPGAKSQLHSGFQECWCDDPASPCQVDALFFAMRSPWT